MTSSEYQFVLLSIVNVASRAVTSLSVVPVPWRGALAKDEELGELRVGWGPNQDYKCLGSCLFFS